MVTMATLLVTVFITVLCVSADSRFKFESDSSESGSDSSESNSGSSESNERWTVNRYKVQEARQPAAEVRAKATSVFGFQKKRTVDLFKPSSDMGPLKERFSWKSLDVLYPSNTERHDAIKSGDFIVENNVPLGIEVWQNKLFINVPRRQKGVPATLCYVDLASKSRSPVLIPYPSLVDNKATDDNGCNNLISVPRSARVDKWDRLWVFDTGKVGRATDGVQVCPPRVHVLDLETNTKLRMYTLKDSDWSSSSIFVNAVVDSDESDCSNTYMYISDERGIIVYSWADNESWRFDHKSFLADVSNSEYNINRVQFTWTDAGIFGMALSSKSSDGFKTLYYHALSSSDEHKVSTKVLINKNKVSNSMNDFVFVGKRSVQERSTTEVMASNGVMYFNVIDKNAVACWNSKETYEPKHFRNIAQSDEKLIFPSDSVIDDNENLWVISNRLPIQMYGVLDLEDTNFRVFSAPISKLDTCYK